MSKTLSENGFRAIADFFYQHSGIRLEASKRHLVVSRLAREAVRLQCHTLNDYVALIMAAPQGAEARHAIDVLTTNETYFFRESAHFKHLAQLLQHDPCTQALRAWSAASSSGEEAYSIAMTLARHAGLRDEQILLSRLGALGEPVLEKNGRSLLPESSARLDHASLARSLAQVFGSAPGAGAPLQKRPA